MWTFGADEEGTGAMRGTLDALLAVREPISPVEGGGRGTSPTSASATAPSLIRLDAGPAAGLGICSLLSMFCRLASRRAVSSDLTEVVEVADAVDKSAEAQADESSIMIESSGEATGAGAEGAATAGRGAVDVEAIGWRPSILADASWTSDGLDGRGKRLAAAVKLGAAADVVEGREVPVDGSGLTTESIAPTPPSAVVVGGRAATVLDIGAEIAGAVRFGNPNVRPAVRCIGTDDNMVREG